MTTPGKGGVGCVGAGGVLLGCLCWHVQTKPSLAFGRAGGGDDVMPSPLSGMSDLNSSNGKVWTDTSRLILSNLCPVICEALWRTAP